MNGLWMRTTYHYAKIENHTLSLLAITEWKTITHTHQSSWRACCTYYLDIISWWGTISLYHFFGDKSNTTIPFRWRLHKTKAIL